MLFWRSNSLQSNKYTKNSSVCKRLQIVTTENKRLVTESKGCIVATLHRRKRLTQLQHRQNHINNTNIKFVNAMRNKVQLIGNVGQDPEIKNLEGGKKVANLTIATNEVYYKENGEKVEQTEWHRVTAWGKPAEIIEKYVTKGKEVAIEGKLTHRSYDDKNGEKRYITEVIVKEIVLI